MGGEADYDEALPGAQTELAPSASETEAHTAWALDDDPEWVSDSWWTPAKITGAAVVAAVVAVVVAAEVSYMHLKSEPSPEPPPPVATVSQIAAPPPPPVQIPTTPPPPPKLVGVDGRFIDEMVRVGVPVDVNDPSWTVELAKAVCATANDPALHYPPGGHTVALLTRGVHENNPAWEQRQAARLTYGALNYYCPEVWGPSDEEIAAMPPDRRYHALLQDRAGLVPVDGSMLQAAYQVCARLAQGWWSDRIAETITGIADMDDKRILIQTAAEVYCPAFSGR